MQYIYLNTWFLCSSSRLILQAHYFFSFTYLLGRLLPNSTYFIRAKERAHTKDHLLNRLITMVELVYCKKYTLFIKLVYVKPFISPLFVEWLTYWIVVRTRPNYFLHCFYTMNMLLHLFSFFHHNSSSSVHLLADLIVSINNSLNCSLITL